MVLIHIHGFLSSSHFSRDVLIQGYIKESSLEMELKSPELPDKPQAIVALLEQLIADAQQRHQPVALLGHSLGGYYATYLAVKHQLPAVLLNPVVRGYEIMCEFFGDCYNPHTNTTFQICEEDIAFLAGLLVGPETITAAASRLMVIQQLADDIVNPGEVLAYYRDCLVIVEKNGNHNFQDFDRHLNEIMAFIREQLDKNNE